MDANKKKLLTVIVMLMLSLPVFAQSLLERATKVYRDSESCELMLNISISNIDNQAEKQKAKLMLNGNKYILEFSDQRIMSDGENSYTFSESANELVIEKIDSLSPLQSPRSLLAIDSSVFEVTNSVEKSGVTTLTLESNKSIAGVNKIDASIEENKLKGIKVTDNGGNTIFIEILSAQFNKKMDDSLFQYNQRNYKGVEIIDFR